MACPDGQNICSSPVPAVGPRSRKNASPRSASLREGALNDWSTARPAVLVRVPGGGHALCDGISNTGLWWPAQGRCCWDLSVLHLAGAGKVMSGRMKQKWRRNDGEGFVHSLGDLLKMPSPNSAASRSFSKNSRDQTGSKLIGNDQKALSCGLVIVSGRSFSA